MRILYLSAAILPSEESHSVSIMRLCQAFADAGHEVVLSGLAPEGSAVDPVEFYGLKGGFRVIRHEAGRIWNTRISRSLLLTGLMLAWKTRRLIREVRPDIVYSRLTVAELALIPQNVPIVYEMHSLGPIGGNILRRFSFRWLVKRHRFRRFVVTTDALAELLGKELPDAEVVVARLSAPEPVAVSDEEMAVFRDTTLQGTGFQHHVGYTGYMDSYGLRGTDIIIETASRMPQTAFHLVGGKPEVVDYWDAYSRKYNEHGNIFFYGHRNPDEMPLFLNCFDVVVAPLQYRPVRRAPAGQNMSPLKLPQYMAYGRAIVASDLPAHRECLSHDDTALLIPADDVEAWTRAIGCLLDNPEKRAAMGKAALAVYQAGYTPRIRVKRILEGL